MKDLTGLPQDARTTGARGEHQRTGPNHQTIIEIHRRKIGKTLAKSLFFNS